MCRKTKGRKFPWWLLLWKLCKSPALLGWGPKCSHLKLATASSCVTFFLGPTGHIWRLEVVLKMALTFNSTSVLPSASLIHSLNRHRVRIFSTRSTMQCSLMETIFWDSHPRENKLALGALWRAVKPRCKADAMKLPKASKFTSLLSWSKANICTVKRNCPFNQPQNVFSPGSPSAPPPAPRAPFEMCRRSVGGGGGALRASGDSGQQPSATHASYTTSCWSIRNANGSLGDKQSWSLWKLTWMEVKSTGSHGCLLRIRPSTGYWRRYGSKTQRPALMELMAEQRGHQKSQRRSQSKRHFLQPGKSGRRLQRDDVWKDSERCVTLT